MASETVTKPGPGKLISLRGREWMVLPSADEEVLLVKPLGGPDDEVTGIYLPLATPPGPPLGTRSLQSPPSRLGHGSPFG